MCSIFQELQIVHDTGYFSALPSLEENWQQTCLELERYLQSEPYVSASDLKFEHQEELDWSFINRRRLYTSFTTDAFTHSFGSFSLSIFKSLLGLNMYSVSQYVQGLSR
uniref:Kruppel like factor 6 n=1 Tax=Neogobius melanostomus TaxID=47308 RepID=A0A8C6UKN0_9GOBI